MNKHTMTLLGGTRGELRVPADVLLETVGALLEGARQATRFFIEGESTRKGPRPAWLDAVCDETPGPKAVRVSGTLDTISATKSDVVLTLSDGTVVAARLDAHDNEQLEALFGSRVVVSGMAQFRPSGTLLVIDVEHLGPARDGDVVFESAPKATAGRPSASLLPQDETSGVSAFFGTWPGDESDEDPAIGRSDDSE